MKRTLTAREGAGPRGRRALALVLLWTASLGALLLLGLSGGDRQPAFLCAWLLGLGLIALSWRTERDRAAEQARQVHAAALEARTLRSMIEGMDEGVVVVDARDVVTEINGWFLRRVGLRREDVVGKGLWQFHPATAGTERARAVVEEFRAGARRGTYVVNRDLLGMHLSLRVQPIFAEGRYQGIILNAIDVTDLDRARRDAEAATRAKDVFLASMSHEIRTPLNAVLGMTGLLLDTTLDDQQRDCLDTLRNAGESLNLLVNDVFDLACVHAGRMQLEQVPFDLRLVLEGVAHAAAGAARARSLELTCCADPSCPRRLIGEPERLRQVLMNLTSNALAFTEHGGVDIFAERLPGGTDGVVIRFTVTDTGAGIQAERGEPEFERIAPADGSAARRPGDVGLGLAISRGLVRLMGGEIGVDSRPGAGSTFWFTLPFRASSEECGAAPRDRAAPPGPEEQDGASAPARRIRVLLAEDNPVNQKVALAMLAKCGCLTDVAANGREAVDAVQRSPYDLVFMDVQMPVMDGLEAAAAIRAMPGSPSRTPIVALTAHALHGYREKCFASGMNDFLAKPVKDDELRRTVALWAPGAARHSGSATPAK